MLKNFIIFITVCSTLTPVSSDAEQIRLLIVDEIWGGSSVVTGQAMAGSVPITVYDLSYSVRTALGSGNSMDDHGYFAVSVDPPLVAGHQIIAVDKDGHESQPVVVTTSPPLTDPTQ